MYERGPIDGGKVPLEFYCYLGSIRKMSVSGSVAMRLTSSILSTCALAMLIVLAAPSRECWGQDTKPLFGPEDSIPKDYESWSLFLLCNPVWLLDSRKSNVVNLYYQFEAFGASIGPKHAAIWFWKSRDSHELFQGNKAVTDIVDASRSSIFCEKYGLLPSEGPHVLVTTSHPDGAPGDHSALKLNGLDTDDINVLLAKVADQLLVKGLQQEELDSERSWQLWKGAVENAFAASAGWIKKVVFTIDTKFLKVEITGGGG